MLIIEKLNYKHILKDITFTLDPGNICGLFGPSGGGKTSLLRVIKNLMKDWTGEITYNYNKINKFDKNIGYLLQESVLFQSKTILENLLLSGAKEEEVVCILKKMELINLLDQDIKSLSGGQKQRLSIARCLLMRPKILLMDEPTSALDPHNADLTLNIIEEYVKETNGIALIISHNVYKLEIYNRLLYLKNGMVEYFGDDLSSLNLIKSSPHGS